MWPLLTGALTFVGICVTAYVTWKLGRRTTSGQIDTTQAETLWRESDQMRQELRDEVVALRGEVGRLQKAVVRLQGEVVRLQEQVDGCRE